MGLCMTPELNQEDITSDHRSTSQRASNLVYRGASRDLNQPKHIMFDGLDSRYLPSIRPGYEDLSKIDRYSRSI